MAGWIVAIVVEDDVRSLVPFCTLMFRTSRMGVYAQVHPGKVICFLLEPLQFAYKANGVFLHQPCRLQSFTIAR